MSPESAFWLSIAGGGAACLAMALFLYVFKVIKRNVGSPVFRIILYLGWFFIGTFAFGAYQNARKNKPKAYQSTSFTFQSNPRSSPLNEPLLSDLPPHRPTPTSPGDGVGTQPIKPIAASSSDLEATEKLVGYFREVSPFIKEAVDNIKENQPKDGKGSVEPQIIRTTNNAFIIPCPRNSVMKMTANNSYADLRNKFSPFQHAYTFTEEVPGSTNVKALYHVSYLAEHEELSGIPYPLYLAFVKDMQKTLENNATKQALVQEYCNMLSRTVNATVANPNMQNFDMTGDYYSNALSCNIEFRGRKTPLIESSTYFFHNNAMFCISVTDFVSRSERESLDKAKIWMSEILRANPIKQDVSIYTINGANTVLPEPPGALPIAISPITSSEGYEPLAAFEEETGLYYIAYKIYHSREPVPLNSFQSTSQSLASGVRNLTRIMGNYYKSDPQYVAHRDPVILENTHAAFTNSQDLDVAIEDIPIRRYSLFSYFQLGNSYIQLRAICSYERNLEFPDGVLGDEINYYAFRRIVAWRDAILAANE